MGAAGEGATVPKAPKEKKSRSMKAVEADSSRSGPDNLISAKLIAEVLQLDAARCKDPNRGKVSPEALALLRSASTNMLRGVAMEAASKMSNSDIMNVSVNSIKRICKREEFSYLGDALDELTGPVTAHRYDALDTAKAAADEPRESSDPTPEKVEASRKRAASDPKPSK